MKITINITAIALFFVISHLSAQTPMPKKVLIGHQQWKIVALPVLPPDGTGDELVGLTFYDTKTIIVSLHEAPGELCETLHHEIMHAIDPHSSELITTRHEFIYLESPALARVYFRDNPQLLKWTVENCAKLPDEPGDGPMIPLH